MRRKSTPREKKRGSLRKTQFFFFFFFLLCFAITFTFIFIGSPCLHLALGLQKISFYRFERRARALCINGGIANAPCGFDGLYTLGRQMCVGFVLGQRRGCANKKWHLQGGYVYVRRRGKQSMRENTLRTICKWAECGRGVMCMCGLCKFFFFMRTSRYGDKVFQVKDDICALPRR